MPSGSVRDADGMRDVFLSYARAESEPLAWQLFERLTAGGFAVWWDRKCMPSRSLTFLQEIRLAVQDAKRTVVIVDRPAVRSEYVRAEWQYALAAGKPVVPLLRLASYDQLPSELASLHCPDFRPERPLDEALEELLRVLSDEVPPLGQLLGEVPGIPPHYQPRVDATTRLAGEVLRGRKVPVTVTGPQRITVLHGMGGSGKSVMAASLVRSTATRQAFDDGLLWLTPNTDARPDDLLRAIGDLLHGTTRNWHTHSDCVDGVREVLSGRRVLVAIDNVHRVELIEPLISALDVDTRVVVTTRHAGLAADLGARSLPLGDLKPSEALQLLADWAGCELEELPRAAAALAAECGYLPFALAVNGSMVRRGTPWQDLIDAFYEHELDFARAHDRFANYPYRNVFRVIRPSILELERNEPLAARALTDLAAFHWAQAVPESAVTRFWTARGTHSPRAARKTLADLADRSLLRLEGDAPVRRVRLHDIQLDYLIATGADPQSLGRALLDSYGRPDDWPSVEPDGYFHQHVVRHLIELGDFSAIEHLLDQTNDVGGNAWFHASEAADNVLGYLEDLDRASGAWAGATGVGSRGPITTAVRHAIIRSSINSMASSVSTPIRTAVLRTSVWSPGRVLAEARQVADPDRRVRALLDSAALLGGAVRKTTIDEALDIARSRGNQQIPAHLARAARLVDPKRRMELLEEARATAHTITLPGYRAVALAETAGQWDADTRGAVVAEALVAAAEEIATAGVNQGVFDALAILAPLLPASSLPRLIDLVRRIPHDFGKAMAFARVVPHIADPVERTRFAEEGASLERSIEGNSVWIRIALATQLPGCDLDQLFDEVARTDDRQIDYLLRLLPEISSQDAERWLGRVREVEFHSERSRFDALLEISRRLDGRARQGLVAELANLAQRLPYQSWRNEAYTALAPQLDAHQIATALRVLRTIDDSHTIGSALASLLPHLRPSLRAKAVDYVLTSVDGSQSLDVLARTPAAVEGALREKALRHALSTWRAGASFGGGAYSPKLMIDAVVELARMAGPPDRMELLQHLVDESIGRSWGAELGAQALVAAAELLGPEVVDRVASHLAQQALDETLHGEVQSIGETHVGRPEALAWTLHVLAPVLTPERAEAFLELADAVPDEGWGMAARVALAARLPEVMRAAVLRASAATAANLDLRVEDPVTNLWRPLLWLTNAVPDDRRDSIAELALLAAQAVGSSWRPAALASVARVVEGSRRGDAIAEALAHGDEYVVPSLLPFLPQEEAWVLASRAVVATIAWGSYPSADLAEFLATGQSAQVHELWHEIASRLRSLTRADLCLRYVALVPLLKSLEGAKAVEDLADSLLTTASWWP